MAPMEEIERRADELLARIPDWLWNGERLPVPIDAIADTHFGLLIREVEDQEMRRLPGAPKLAEGQKLSGLLLSGPGEIWVNAEEAAQWPQRRRFTIAHEIGHYELHCEDDRSLFCRSATVIEDEEQPPPAEPRENEANVFAAALMMPAHLMREHYARLREQPEKDCFWEMCQLFGASTKAMGRRLHTAIPRSA
jgi:IrrE N-terminal-like domain